MTELLEINKIASFVFYPTFTNWLLVLKILFIIFSLFFFGFIVFTFIKSTWLKRMIIWDLQNFLSYKPFGLKKTEKQWWRIKKRLVTEIEAEWKLAIIEADKILDDVLELMGFGGTGLGERLDKLTVSSLPNIKDVREAHKTRNNIVHDPTYKLSLEEAKKATSIYEKALTDLHVL